MWNYSLFYLTNRMATWPSSCCAPFGTSFHVCLANFIDGTIFVKKPQIISSSIHVRIKPRKPFDNCSS